MIDHLVGRPSPSWKRLQVFLVVIFWFWRILYGNPGGPRVLWLRRVNRALQRFTPWQLIVSTLTGVYAVRNIDKILGLGSPEPLANLYSPNYYRATWINTGLDAGFATAMSIRPKWLRDISSIIFSVYYIIYATEADEKLRRFRAVPTVELLRATWEKTTNPYIRMFAILPPISVRRKLLLPRPKDSPYQRPITAWLFFAPADHLLSRATELILDFPGGGFISMTPEHHEERLRIWAVRTGKPVLSIEYGKAPEYPYPFAIDECFDVYRTLVESAGQIIGMSGVKMETIFTGDSAGAHIAVGVMIKILETQLAVPHPLALQLNYAALDFNYSSWMTPTNLRVLQSEQSSGNLQGLAEQKDHFKHISPLSMVGDQKPLRSRRRWRDAFRALASPVSERPQLNRSRETAPILRKQSHHLSKVKGLSEGGIDESGSMADDEDGALPEEERPIRARVRFHPVIDEVQSPEAFEHEHKEDSGFSSETTKEGDGINRKQLQQQLESDESVLVGTRLTMTSRTGYFQDRVISPSMMRAMAILFIGPRRNPDFTSDYYLSPVLAPAHLLAQFPPLLMTCGEKDPFVDDTVIFAGRLREAKRARMKELAETLAGKNTKYSEHLSANILNNDLKDDNDSFRAMKHELNELSSQTEEDWVQMHIFTDWSHGYMQMAPLLKEARIVTNDLADWMNSIFVGQRGRGGNKLNTVDTSASWRPRRRHGSGVASTSTPFTSETEMETETDDGAEFTMTKKQSPPTSFSSHQQEKSSRAGKEGSYAKQSALSPVSPVYPIHEAGSHKAHPSVSAAIPSFISVPVRRPTPTTLKVGSPKGGQTITESELMRRRRLLDAHLIHSDSVKFGDKT
ncbi:Alpha/Beta hydrolase protein [Irpex rosettiformis]|uniref:Alpha/Beta hydrolase protein n=1 Tax=Irpex rosettiformis TaxID=378272 RepID=A0ACB8UBN1_9APHY|nr:Alpha/Beta hydrolase protein [Irpex rosettiformis]